MKNKIAPIFTIQFLKGHKIEGDFMKKSILILFAFCLLVGCSGTFNAIKKYYDSQTDNRSYDFPTIDTNDIKYPFIRVVPPIAEISKSHCERIDYFNENALANLGNDTSKSLSFYYKIVDLYHQTEKDSLISTEKREYLRKLYQPYYIIATAAIDTLHRKVLLKLKTDLTQAIIFQSQGNFTNAIVSYRAILQGSHQLIGNNSSIESQCSDSIKSCFNLLRTKYPIDFQKLDGFAVKYDSLNKIASKFNLFEIFGEIKDRDEKRLILWGRAIPVNGNLNALGSLMEEGNIVVYNYGQENISINFYKGRHVYKEKTYGSNAFGGLVGAYAYENSIEYQKIIEETEYILLLRKQLINSMGLTEVIKQ